MDVKTCRDPSEAYQTKPTVGLVNVLIIFLFLIVQRFLKRKKLNITDNNQTFSHEKKWKHYNRATSSGVITFEAVVGKTIMSLLYGDLKDVFFHSRLGFVLSFFLILS